MSTKGKMTWYNPDWNKPLNCPNCGRFMKYKNSYEDVMEDYDSYWYRVYEYVCRSCGWEDNREIATWEYKEAE